MNLAIEPLVIFHDGLYHSAFWYYITTIGRFILVAVVSALTMFVMHWIPDAGLLWIVVRVIISALIVLPIYWVVFRKNDDAITMIRTLKIAFTRRKNKTVTE